MRSQWRFILLATLSFVVLHPVAWSQTQAEMNEQAQERLAGADARLNAVYKKLLSERATESEFCENLRSAQRAWLKFVDLHMQSVFPLAKNEDPRAVYGSIYPLDHAEQKRPLIEARTRQLEDLLARAE